MDTGVFRVRPGERVQLKQRPTVTKPLYRSEEDYLKQLAASIEELSALQTRLYADNRYSLLIVFQSMDTGGKDGAIRHIMSGVNPQGCQVYSFKRPSAEELDHDFLWRTTRVLPERGCIGIFNRSYYEEVLVVRVHPEILKSQGLPKETLEDKRIWEKRFESIRDLEKHLHRNGTRVVKFYLHLSKEEQRRRLLARLDNPEKRWKFDRDDLSERKLWKQYRRAYEECFGATSTKRSPWYVVPADDKKNARLILSRIVLEVLGGLKLEYPNSTLTEKELRALRAGLAGLAGLAG